MAQIILHAALCQQVEYTTDREKERERESDIVKETEGRGATTVREQSIETCLPAAQVVKLLTICNFTLVCILLHV